MADHSAAIKAQVESAYQQQRPVNIIGGGSKSFMGRVSVGEPLNLAQHSGIVAYEPTELVLTARAGTPITEIQQVLAAHDQQLAFEPPAFKGKATLGGTLAGNQSGPCRPWQGSVRDAVLGVRLINGRGEHLKFGGQVMKNVAGYDLSRLQAGAMGCLGVITEISLKVIPKPAVSSSLMVTMSEQDALVLMTSLRRRAIPLSGACWSAGKINLRLAGAESAVNAAAKELGAHFDATSADAEQDFWNNLREQQLSFFSSDQPIWRLSVNPASPPLPLHYSKKSQQIIDWGGAQRWLAGDFKFEQVQLLAQQAKGHASLYRGRNLKGEQREPAKGEVFQSLPAPLQALHRRVKKAVDPAGILNPGRLYSWL